MPYRLINGLKSIKVISIIGRRGRSSIEEKNMQKVNGSRLITSCLSSITQFTHASNILSENMSFSISEI